MNNECVLKPDTPLTSVVKPLALTAGIPQLKNSDLNLPKSETKISISADTAFESGSAKLTWDAETALNQFKGNVNRTSNALSDFNFCITIVGHTDRVPFKKTVKKTNQQLSLERANAVKTFLLEGAIAPLDETYFIARGAGETECVPEVYEKPNDPKCRRVDITLKTGAKCTQ